MSIWRRVKYVCQSSILASAAGTLQAPNTILACINRQMIINEILQYLDIYLSIIAQHFGTISKKMVEISRRELSRLPTECSGFRAVSCCIFSPEHELTFTQTSPPASIDPARPVCCRTSHEILLACSPSNSYLHPHQPDRHDWAHATDIIN